MAADNAPRSIDRLLEIMARLRDPHGGCPWDIEQTFASIAPYTIEEAYEVADAIDRGDMAGLREELGDLLLQVVYHARMAEEAEEFDFDAVALAIADKMVRRHPHVFGEEKIASAADQSVAWEKHKASERSSRHGPDGVDASALDNVPLALPALTRAEKLGRRAARTGFDWPEASRVIAKIEEEIAEIRAEIDTGGGPDRLLDETGDLLFACANLARHLGVDAEASLRAANAKFERRFRSIETQLAKDGKTPEDAPLDELERLWDKAKAEENPTAHQNTEGD